MTARSCSSYPGGMRELTMTVCLEESGEPAESSPSSGGADGVCGGKRAPSPSAPSSTVALPFCFWVGIFILALFVFRLLAFGSWKHSAL